MNYQETLKYINDTPKFSKILGNDNLLKLLDALGNPQDKLSFIHIAGTNGKGSVSAMTAAILRKAGYKTGLFTSPYIMEFNERIQIDGECIKDSELAEIATLVRDTLNKLSLEISVFAQITAMAFLYFEKEKCDIVVLETGLGGRLDATNVVKTVRAVAITKISFDHTEWLGDTLSKIASEKCGIIKEGVPVFTCENQHKEALSVIEAFSSEKNAPLAKCTFSPYPTSLFGEFQRENAGICVELCRSLGINEKIIEYGLSHTQWIARCEFISENLLIDGGHNPDGVKALTETLNSYGAPVHFVVAMMEDKNVSETSSFISAIAKSVTVTQLEMPRCMKACELSVYFPGATIYENPIEAVKYALDKALSDELVCVCGSLYLAGEIRKYFK